ncbi:MAG TPA: UdgX family uracil-DNA binding protein [Gemmatimonadaceae bacterium]|nr:UdgX family uracil-DNA binding protein [Gemmatimonadaceae bacterium]
MKSTVVKPESQSPEPAAWRDAVEQGVASLADAEAAARGCQACRLWRNATQTVFGNSESRKKPRLMLVGEQPGDREDVAGEPFVGPAGRLLDDALEAAGIDRKTAYLTNVVKHFSFELRGKRRIHKKPKADEIRACRPWLEAEIAALQPALVICLGATAAHAILGPSFRVTKSRGTLVSSPIAPRVMATVHPSSILRAADDESRRAEMQSFIDDLMEAQRILDSRNG